NLTRGVLRGKLAGKEWRPCRVRGRRVGTPSLPAAPRRRVAWRGGCPRSCRGMRGDALLNDLIRPPQKRRRNRQPKRLRSLEVDHKLELGGLFDGEIARLGALQDLVDVGSRAPKQVREAGAIGRETTYIDVPANV